jgi:hypothetical protein
MVVVVVVVEGGTVVDVVVVEVVDEVVVVVAVVVVVVAGGGEEPPVGPPPQAGSTVSHRSGSQVRRRRVGHLAFRIGPEGTIRAPARKGFLRYTTAGSSGVPDHFVRLAAPSSVMVMMSS